MKKYRFDDIAFNSTEKKKPTDEDKYTYIGLEHLDPGSLKVTRYGSDVAPKGEKLIMRKGDVLFGKRRAYQKKVGIAPFDGIFSAHGMVLRPKETIIDKEFFPLFIASDYFLDAAIKISVGSLSPTINWRDLKELEFELPSLEKQRKLAKVLWAIIDTIEANRTLISATDELVESQFIEWFGSIEQKTEWKRKRWEEVCEIRNGRDYKAVACDDGEYPVYGSGGYMGRAKEYSCPENTVIVGRKGTIDKPLLVREKFWNVDTAFGIIPNQNLIHYQYLFWFCKQFDFLSLNKGTTLPSTTKIDLQKIEINIPPIELQDQFALFVEQSDKSKCELDKAVKNLEAMYKKILKDNLG